MFPTETIYLTIKKITQIFRSTVDTNWIEESGSRDIYIQSIEVERSVFSRGQPSNLHSRFTQDGQPTSIYLIRETKFDPEDLTPQLLTPFNISSPVNPPGSSYNYNHNLYFIYQKSHPEQLYHTIFDISGIIHTSYNIFTDLTLQTKKQKVFVDLSLNTTTYNFRDISNTTLYSIQSIYQPHLPAIDYQLDYTRNNNYPTGLLTLLLRDGPLSPETFEYNYRFGVNYSLDDGQWHLVIVSQKDNTIRLWIDGEIQSLALIDENGFINQQATLADTSFQGGNSQISVGITSDGTTLGSWSNSKSSNNLYIGDTNGNMSLQGYRLYPEFIDTSQNIELFQEFYIQTYPLKNTAYNNYLENEPYQGAIRDFWLSETEDGVSLISLIIKQLVVTVMIEIVRLLETVDQYLSGGRLPGT